MVPFDLRWVGCAAAVVGMVSSSLVCLDLVNLDEGSVTDSHKVCEVACCARALKNLCERWQLLGSYAPE